MRKVRRTDFMENLWGTVVVAVVVMIVWFVFAAEAWTSYEEGGTSLLGAIVYTAFVPVLIVGSTVGDIVHRRRKRSPH